MFFPGSFFDKIITALENDKNLRVVFVAREKDKVRYGVHLMPRVSHLKDQVILETVPYSESYTHIQKIFMFFYSYFIYTGTTRMLATIGMRAEDAPGSARKSLGALKFLISRTFGRSKLIKTKLVPLLYNLVFKERSFKEIFDKYKPDVVFLPSLFCKFDMKLLREAKEEKVKTIGMVSNWDHFDKYYLPMHVDTVLAQSEQVKNFAIKFQAYNPEEISIVGFPHFDFITNNQHATSRGEILKSLEFFENSKYIVYISGSMSCPDEPDIIEKILQWIDEGKFGDVRLVIRPYPGVRGKDIAFDEKKFEGFKKHPKVSFYMDKFWGDLEKSIYFVNLMRHADIIIAIYSTAALEAVALNRPVITASFDGYSNRPYNRSVKRFEIRDHFRDVIQTKAIRKTESFDELFDSIKLYLKDPSSDQDKREILQKKILYKIDGKSSERVFNHLMSEL